MGGGLDYMRGDIAELLEPAADARLASAIQAVNRIEQGANLLEDRLALFAGGARRIDWRGPANGEPERLADGRAEPIVTVSGNGRPRRWQVL